MLRCWASGTCVRTTTVNLEELNGVPSVLPDAFEGPLVRNPLVARTQIYRSIHVSISQGYNDRVHDTYLQNLSCSGPNLPVATGIVGWRQKLAHGVSPSRHGARFILRISLEARRPEQIPELFGNIA